MAANGRETHRPDVVWTPPAGGRWSEEEARAGLQAAQASGETLSSFARRHGVNQSRLYWWRKQLGRDRVKAASFLPVRVVASAPEPRPRERRGGVHGCASLEIVVRGKTVVRVAQGFDPDLLCAVVAALEGGEKAC